MCLSIIEILFLVTGLWMLISGKVPAKIFQPLFGKGNYVLSSMQTRLFGLLLASPLPLVFVVSLFLQLVLTENQFGWSAAFEITYDLAVILVALIVARRIRQPLVPKGDVAEIQKA